MGATNDVLNFCHAHFEQEQISAREDTGNLSEFGIRTLCISYFMLINDWKCMNTLIFIHLVKFLYNRVEKMYILTNKCPILPNFEQLAISTSKYGMNLAYFGI